MLVDLYCTVTDLTCRAQLILHLDTSNLRPKEALRLLSLKDENLKVKLAGWLNANFEDLLPEEVVLCQQVTSYAYDTHT